MAVRVKHHAEEPSSVKAGICTSWLTIPVLGKKKMNRCSRPV